MKLVSIKTTDGERVDYKTDDFELPEKLYYNTWISIPASNGVKYISLSQIVSVTVREL